MDVWGGSQGADARAQGGADDEEEQWEAEDKGKDALIVLVDARAQMFAPYEPAEDADGGASAAPSSSSSAAAAAPPPTWFHAVLALLVRLLKAKVVAGDNSLISVVLFGSTKRAPEASSLEHVYELQPLGHASAQRIQQLQSLARLSERDLQREVGAMANSDALAFSNALWHCGIAFSGAALKKKDSQRVWIFTNDDACVTPDGDEVGRVRRQVQNHAELKRTLNLFYAPPPGTHQFDLARFYGCAFKDFANDDGGEGGGDVAAVADALQPAFPVASLDDLMETTLRKRFRKRRLSTFPLHVTKQVSIGVELYAVAVVQRKSYPVHLDASTNAPLKSETKWLCDDTGLYLTPDQIKTYVPYGGQRVYFSRDDMVQLKHYAAPGLQLICFKPLHTLKWNENLRSPYFVYPCDGYIEGSATAFLALLTAMARRGKYALARLVARKTSEPRLVALVPQEEVHDELGQVQPTGFNVVFLPYVDDIRDVDVEYEERPNVEQVEAATKLISKLKLSELPSFENPELQKHYASVQALALGEEQLEFDESKDMTLPDAEGFARSEVQDAIAGFKDVCGDVDRSNLKRKEKTAAPKRAPKKKAAKAGGDDGGPVAADAYGKVAWAPLVANNGIHKKTVVELKEFLTAHGLPIAGRKPDLVARALDFLEA